MSQPIQTSLDVGASGLIVDIECHLSNGLPTMLVVGLGNKSIDEAKERIRSAFASSKLTLPAKRIIINLAPADIPKDSTSFDLGIALAILQQSGQTTRQLTKNEAVIGELGLDGHTRPVRGIIGKILAGERNGITTFYIPAANVQQALLVPHVTLIPIDTLRDAYLDLAGTIELKRLQTNDGLTPEMEASTDYPCLLDEIVGQAGAKRALEIAAAGGHNLFLSGPPGTGKSMLAKALPSLLPPLSQREILEVTHLHSLATNAYDKLILNRPFRSPHHSSSSVSIIGGGNIIRPGEISLSHRGVLLLDEMPEFSRTTIEALRQPLEDRTINITRARDSVLYPANFLLVATANPCPCGYYGSSKPCSCSVSAIARYRQKMSGPILDRIDLFVAVEAVEHSKLLTQRTREQQHTEAIRARITKARATQRSRFESSEKTNAHMTNQDIRTLARLSDVAIELLDRAARQCNISARSYMRTIKVARTIADLDSEIKIGTQHITEALRYRNYETSGPV